MALPEVEIVLLKSPLYEKFEIRKEDYKNAYNLFYCRERIDFYCPICQKDSTFEGKNQPISAKTGTYQSFEQISKVSHVEHRNELFEIYCNFQNKLLNIEFECTRNREHKAVFHFYKYENELIKLGQFPSIAQLNQDRIKKYRKVLTKEQYKELNRGIGLTSHGVGIGAFVYLRRIFENLIFEAIDKAVKSGTINQEEFEGIRMNDKIKKLKDFVPKFLSENSDIYGLLSKGIHELSENECLEFFPVLQVGIELILDEKYELKLREEKQQNISKELDRLKGKINKKENGS